MSVSCSKSIAPVEFRVRRILRDFFCYQVSDALQQLHRFLVGKSIWVLLLNAHSIRKQLFKLLLKQRMIEETPAVYFHWNGLFEFIIRDSDFSSKGLCTFNISFIHRLNRGWTTAYVSFEER